ncbi:hypothetical protein PV10_00768 [Exophiala mesophila]|uniref:Probable glucan endo-1,3-beta-glucosidase eglC n=1 Tax=Exophiala mesophila TaxID=212818 RepID=A0A0D2ADI3_EXOME|nr:uncharacterized protein PV10_00768 [Exophiala mesophila]KIV96958.1 hypothetical protein PV10_00768 [Exophiala mesophila]
MKSSILALFGSSSVALAAVRGFNYGSQGHSHGSFTEQFKIAANLEGANDYTSARLYTMIQEGTTNTPIEAIQAAIDTKTTLLLGLWASIDEAAFQQEITALQTSIQQYGSAFADLVVGISVGSEDLYRISPIGIAADSGYGQSPDVLVKYIDQVRTAIQGTSLASKPIGHVDTWNVYVNSSNAAVIAACDWIGLDEYPYYQTTDENEIGNAKTLFFEAYDKVGAVADGKPIWITEAGWPVSGPTSNLATASVNNAEIFWQEVACELERREVNTWWYILDDSGASPSFGVSENGKPLYNLDCSQSASNTTSSSSVTSAHSTSAGPTASSGSSVVPTGITTASGSASSMATSDATPNPTGASATTLRTGTSTSGQSSSTTSAEGSAFTNGVAPNNQQSMAGIAIGAVLAALVL